MPGLLARLYIQLLLFSLSQPENQDLVQRIVQAIISQSSVAVI